MKKFIKILLAISAITVMLTGCETEQPPVPVQTPQNTVANTNTSTPEPVKTPTPEVLETWSGESAEAAEKALLKYAKETLNLDEKEAPRRLVDLDQDGVPELINISNEVGATNIQLYELSKDEVKPIKFEYGLLMGKDVVEIRELNGVKHIFVRANFEDGLCYESFYLVELMRDDGKMSFGNPFGYTCDQEAEDKLREALHKKSGDSVTEQDEAACHTLKYYSKGEVVSKEQFEKDLKQFEEDYKLVRKLETKEQPKVSVQSNEKDDIKGK